MLDQKDISKFVKPFTITLIIKTILLTIILIFLSTKNLTGISYHNVQIFHCDAYLNQKTSKFQSKILLAQFLIVLFGSIISIINLTVFVGFLFILRKQKHQKISQQKRLSQSQLKFHFIITFIQLICIINIFSRSIEKLNEQKSCSIVNKNDFILTLIISVLALLVSGIGIFLLFKLLYMAQKRLKSIEEFNFYTDQITLQENLLFNKSGYIQDLIKLDNYTSQASSLREQIVKTFPSGFKKNDLSPLRKIVYRLKGGNKKDGPQNKKKHKKTKPVQKVQQQMEIEFQIGNNQNEEEMKNQLQKTPSNQEKNNKLNLLSVNEKVFDQSPNDENYQRVQLTLNVIQLNINGKLQNLQNQDQNSNEQNQQNNSQSNQLIKMKKIPFKKGQSNIPGSPKRQKKVPVQVKLEQELRQKFNLTPNVDTRKKYAKKKNTQNIDDHGNYYFVDVNKIQKKSKLLNFDKIDESKDNVDHNILYAKKTWSPKQKRIGKKHQKNILQYLKNLEKIRKQQTLCQQESSQYSESFEEQELSSQISQSSSQDQNQINPTGEQNIMNVESSQLKKSRTKIKKNRDPQLYLHMKRKNKTGVQNKLKLFEDQQGFYDPVSQHEDSKADQNLINYDGQRIIDNQLSIDKALRKDQTFEKSKHEQKFNLQNKELQTEQARMLRFIRKKYIHQDQNKKILNFGMVSNSVQQQQLNQNSIFLPQNQQVS